MKKVVTIGSVIEPSYEFNLDASLRVHRMLIERSLNKQWRFKGRWVTTGPFETLMGYPGCGSSLGGTDWASLKLFPRDGVEAMTKQVNRLIWRTMTAFPELAMLREAVPFRPFVHCRDVIDELRMYEKGRTRRQLNSHHKRATLVKNVCLDCRDSGVYLNAVVSFNTQPTESSWGLWWLARSNNPKWNERHRLATWLKSATKEIDRLVRKYR